MNLFKLDFIKIIEVYFKSMILLTFNDDIPSISYKTALLKSYYVTNSTLIKEFDISISLV